MPRAVPRAWGTLLAMAVFAAASVAGGQAPAPPAQTNPPGKRAPAAESIVLSPAQQRLEEIKVELALLGDIDTFPYTVGTSCRSGALDLYGFVPDEMARQNVLEIARRSTHLKINDGLGTRVDQSARSAVRPADALQKDGDELLRNHLRDKSKKIALHVRPDSVVILTGSIDSMERKLQISRLFRQLSGCAGVDNLLSVEPIVRDGKSVVKVVCDGSLVLPAAEAGSPSKALAESPRSPAKIKQVNFTEKVEPAAAPTPGPMPSAAPTPAPPKASTNPKPTVPAPAQTEALRPTAAASPKPPVTLPTPVPEGNNSQVNALKAPKLPVKWGRPPESWETQAKQLEPRFEKPQAVPQNVHPVGSRSVETIIVPNSPPQNLPGPAPVRTPKRDFWMAEPVDVIGALRRMRSQAKARRVEAERQESNQAPINLAELRKVRPAAMAANRLGGEENSEPMSQSATSHKDVPLRPLTDRIKVGPPLRSPRPWPPAYVTGPPIRKEPNAERQESSAKEIEPRYELSEEQHADRVTGTELRNEPSEPLHVKPVSRAVSRKEPAEQTLGGIAMGTPGPKQPSHEHHGTIVLESPSSKESSHERHGTIILTEDPLPATNTPSQFASTRRIAPSDLQRQLKTLCGRQAREVNVMVHIDGGLLVRVKVPNRTIEDQLSRKILSLPEMQSPKVRLLMEVEQ